MATLKDLKNRFSKVVQTHTGILGIAILLIASFLLVGGLSFSGLNSRLANIGVLYTDYERRAFAHGFVYKCNITDGKELLWCRTSPSDFATTYMNVTSNDPSKGVFIGVAEPSDVEAFFNNVTILEITFPDIKWRPISKTFNLMRLSILKFFLPELEVPRNPFQNIVRNRVKRTIKGNTEPESPTAQTFWIKAEHGTGSQTIEWQPEIGNYWIVMMNEDRSAGIDLTTRWVVKFQLPDSIGLALFTSGLIALIVGCIVITFTIGRAVGRKQTTTRALKPPTEQKQK